MLINLRNALMTGKRLPYDAEVEYLESTGMQYVDTGVIPDDSTGIEVVHTICPDNEKDNIIFGARQDSGNTRYWSDVDWGSNDSVGWGFNTYSGNSERFVLSSSDAGRVVTNSLNYMNDRAGKIDGVTYDSSLQSKTLATMNRRIYLFGANNMGTIAFIGKFKVYSAKISKGQTLVRDLIPVRKGTVGYLYDRVSGKLFGNAGTGDFVLGQDVVPVEYIESHGTEWIDTGFKANTTTTRLDCGIVPLNTSTVQGLCGSRNTIGLANDEAANIFVINGNLRLDWLNGYQGGAQTYAISSGSDYDVSITRGTAVINGTTLTSTNDASIAESVNFLLGNFSNGTAGPYGTGFIGRWKQAKLFSNGVIVRSFRPVRVGTGSTWEGAMMDTLTRRIYRNQGTGAFGYGNDLKYPIPSE